MSSLLGIIRKADYDDPARQRTFGSRVSLLGCQEGGSGRSGSDNCMDYGTYRVRVGPHKKSEAADSDAKDAEEAQSAPCRDLNCYLDLLKRSDEENEGGDCEGTKILATFIWNHGGKEVYLICHENGEQKKLKMAKSDTNFILIRYIPKTIYEYTFLVDGEERYAWDQAHNRTDKGVRNFVDGYYVMPIQSIMAAESKEVEDVEFGEIYPDSNFTTQEAIQIPGLLLYRPPIFEGGDRRANDIHVMTRHIYQDSEFNKILGPNYRCYATLQRWERKTDDVASSHNSVTVIYIIKNGGSVDTLATAEPEDWFKVIV